MMFSTPPNRDDILAAIDIGTNNCRLLIAGLTPDEGGQLKPEIIDAFSRLVRLGEGLSKEPQLQEHAITRTLEGLSVCYAKMHRRGVTRYRAVATEACRRAGNTQDFLARVKKLTGLDIEIIDPTEEARLALQGCAPLFEPGFDYGLHFDIGGGSTEIVWAKLNPSISISAQISIPCGVTALTETYGGDSVSAETYKAMVDHVSSHLQPLADQIAAEVQAAKGRTQFLGCAGTISTIAALSQDLPFYQRARVDGYHLSMDEARRIFKQLQGLDYKSRALIPALGNERADLILAGCAIVDAIGTMWDADVIRVADRGVREGILYDMVGIGRIGQMEKA